MSPLTRPDVGLAGSGRAGCGSIAKGIAARGRGGHGRSPLVSSRGLSGAPGAASLMVAAVAAAPRYGEAQRGAGFLWRLGQEPPAQAFRGSPGQGQLLPPSSCTP